MLGGHDHVIICTGCKQKEDLEEDTLRDMWMHDNITNDVMHAEWKPY